MLKTIKREVNANYEVLTDVLEDFAEDNEAKEEILSNIDDPTMLFKILKEYHNHAEQDKDLEKIYFEIGVIKMVLDMIKKDDFTVSKAKDKIRIAEEF